MQEVDKELINESKNDRGNKGLRIFNYIFAAALFLFILVYMIIQLTKGDPENRFFSCISLMGVVIVPFILELIFRFRFSNFTLIFIYTYILFAGVIGSVLYVYKHLPGYDKVVHFIMGYCGAIAGLYIIIKLKDYDKMKVLSLILFFFAFSMAIGGVWEIGEFFGSLYLNQQAQGAPIDGVIPVYDTMWDIVADCGGAILFCLHFLIHRLTNKNLGLGSVIKDFKR